MVEDERVSYFTLTVRTFGVTKGFVTSGVARIKVTIALPTFCTALDLKFRTLVRTKLDQCMKSIRRTVVTLWIDGLTTSTITHGDTFQFHGI